MKCALVVGMLTAGMVISPAALADKSDAANNGRTEIHLMQQAERVMPRDRIQAILRVETKGNNPRQLQIEVNRLMAAALEKAKADPAIVAETGSYSVFQTYDPNPAHTETWHAAQTLSLTSNDFDAVLTLVGELQNQGLLMSEMQFFLSPEALKATQDDLTAEALKKLQERAQSVAQDLDMSIDRMKQISVGNAGEMANRALPMKAATAASVGGKSPPPVARAGDALITLTVNADVLLTPKSVR